MTTTTAAALADIEGVDHGGALTTLHDELKSGRLALVWWHPQALSPLACRSCSGAAGAEPLNLLQEIHENGCDVIGLTYETPERVVRYLKDIGLEYPILSVDRDAARAHGVAKVEGEAWESIPHRVAFLVDEHGQIINRYEVHDATLFLRTVRDDVRNGPPPAVWETPKRGFLSKLLGR